MTTIYTTQGVVKVKEDYNLVMIRIETGKKFLELTEEIIIHLRDGIFDERKISALIQVSHIVRIVGDK